MFEIGLGHYLNIRSNNFLQLALLEFFLNRKNVIVILMSIELDIFLRLISIWFLFQFILGRFNWANIYIIYFNCCSSRSCNWFSYYCNLLSEILEQLRVQEIDKLKG